MDEITEQYFNLVAIHEAGHVAACHMTGTRFNRVYVSENDSMVDQDRDQLPDDYRHQVFILLAGAAAECIFFDAFLSENVIEDVNRALAFGPDDPQAVNKLMPMIDKATRLLEPYRAEIFAIGQALFARRALTYQETLELWESC